MTLNGVARPVPVVVIVGYVVFAVIVAAGWPLLAYSTSLALFGLAHVVVELRYVDARFGRRFPLGLWVAAAAPLSIIVALRAARGAGALDGVDGRWLAAAQVPLELGLVAAMVAGGAICSRAGGRPIVVGGAFAAALVAAIVVAPLEGLLTMSLLHNLTPVGFIVERAAPGTRARAAAGALLVFLGAPAMVASGILGTVIDVDVARAFSSAGLLSEHLGVYLWPAWRDGDLAVRLFGAAVCAQLLHYGAVIVWLPRALLSTERPTLPWPPWPTLVGALVVIGASLAVHFAIDFSEARTLYALPAAVHAWIELPILAVALSAMAPTSPATAR